MNIGQHLWHNLSAGDDLPNTFNMIVETPKLSRNKYEYNKELGVIQLDRVLYSPTHYPGDYGFIPQTYFDDGDPMDVILVNNEATFPGCLIVARPLGMFQMIDSGEEDYKVLAVAHTDPHFGDYGDLNDVPQHFLKEVRHFFQVYKELQGLKVEVQGWVGLEAAKEAIMHSRKLYDDKFGQDGI